MFLRLFFAWLMLVSLAGCSGKSGSTVLDQDAPKDPSLDDSYYDQEKYDAMIYDADPTPPQ